MTTSSKPCVVLVHGSWHQPRHWEPISERLGAAGYDVVAVDLPSCSGVAMDDAAVQDITAIRKAIENFTAAGRDVVVVMHSYGGFVGSEAIGEYMEARNAEEAATASTGTASPRGKIVHLVYVAAMILERGVSTATEPFSGRMPVDLADGLVYSLAPYTNFYNTTPPPVARRAIGLIRPQSISPATHPCKHRGWADYDIPLTYLECTQDFALSCEKDQARFLGRLEKAGLTSFTKKTLDCDHSPWLSKQEEFWSILTEVLEKAETSK